MTSSISTVSWTEKIGYGLSGIATSLMWGTISGFLPYFYTDVFGLSVGAMTMIFFVSRFWDLIADFLMGGIADRTKTRWGKFRPWLLWGCVPFGVVALLTFTVPAFGPTTKVAYAGITYILLMTCYTICVIPQNALQGVMSSDPQERTKITSIAGVLSSVGGLLVAACTLPMVNYLGGGNEAKGYQWTIGIFAGLMIILYVLTFFTVRERVEPPKQQHNSMWMDAKDLLHNKAWLLLFFSGVLMALASSCRGGVSIHFNKYILNDKDLTTVLRTISVATAMLGAMVTPLVGRWLGKSRALGLCVAGVAVSCFMMYFATTDRLWIAYISTGLCDFVGGIAITLFFAMLGDTADFSEWQHGRRATGIIYAAGAVSLKSGFTFGGLLSGGLLGLFGYQANVVQTAHSLLGIKLAAIAVPSLLFLLATIPMWFYPLNAKTLEEMKLELERRRRESAPAPEESVA
jgi:GPH family glycoside/pentoside/hexuronide:cation symporter